MTDLDLLIAKDQVADCIYRLFTATDQRDWPTVERCFAPSVHFDMTSLAGGSPVTLTPREITDGWDQGLRPLQAVHHQAGNLQIQVDGSRATALCYGITYHYRPTRSGQNTRTFVGSYDFALERFSDDWRIILFRFTLKFIEGNRDLDNTP
jgi:hypothetical protein